MALTDRGVRHILDLRKKMLRSRTQAVVLVSQLSDPTGMADPAAPALADGGPGGTFPGGSLYAVCVARGASGQTRAGAEAGPLVLAANHLAQIIPTAQAGATAFDVYAGLAAGAETFAGSTTAGVPLTLSAPLPAGDAAPYNSYTAVQAIFRHQRGVNPADLDEAGVTGLTGLTGLTGDRRLMEVLVELGIDVNLAGVTMLAATGTPTPAAVVAAETYLFVDLV
ncbi:MAG: hypothetical protein ACYDAG_15355, partial [Chloroflexota bacterium]